ncbi:MAG: CYTH domain-containing protein [Armatimonadota bacterium]|nr:CYTH domain-containing protein [Armatimonadota bacterium]
MAPPAADLETEFSLTIAAADPEATSLAVVSLARLGPYRLQPGPLLLLRDLYFDTPEEALRAAHVTLRIRSVGGELWVALKGDEERLPGAGVRRLEIERPWPEGAPEVAAELDARGLGGLRFSHLPGAGDPRASVRAVGLAVVQDRECQRAVRHLVESGDPGATAAEMAVDAVVYHLPGVDVRHYEVEFEARGPGGADAARRAAALLHDAFRPALRPGVGSKLAIGRALERLRRSGVLADLVGPGGVLSPAAYDRLAAEIGA